MKETDVFRAAQEEEAERETFCRQKRLVEWGAEVKTRRS